MFLRLAQCGLRTAASGKIPPNREQRHGHAPESERTANRQYEARDAGEGDKPYHAKAGKGKDKTGLHFSLGGYSAAPRRRVFIQAYWSHLNQCAHQNPNENKQ